MQYHVTDSHKMGIETSLNPRAYDKIVVDNEKVSPVCITYSHPACIVFPCLLGSHDPDVPFPGKLPGPSLRL
ncbi:protein of unknown function [Pseudodesulfovibrio piezophilus C1TLV30]|uniref:Uncharacterized protein n=1 Tax=Pseudodesulfovibrio piezophilus (strain DSM 21447 / JCM 15486 / C1TLV30) TaxID=1322246 RepID=M1WR79_PSEP2|nr:protein of unknown function [Pseudodesulfovibrio piezophilus C1TLV30]